MEDQLHLFDKIFCELENTEQIQALIILCDLGVHYGIFFLSFFLLLPKGEKYVERATKSLQQE